MLVDVPNVPLDVYIALCVGIATPWLYRIYTLFASNSDRSWRNGTLSTLLLVHSLYMLHPLLVSQPQNIFESLGVPVNIPPEYLRSKLVEVFGAEQNIPPYLATLSKRLGLLELRSMYVRFGHNVVTSCFYCKSSTDFALYAFPTPLLEYIREIAFVGILTLPRTPTSYLRPLGLGILLASLLAEIYWTLTVEVVIPPFGNDAPVSMWHDIFIQLRHFLFFFLPLLITVLPYLGLHRIPIIGNFIPAPPRSRLPASQFRLQGQAVAIPPDVTLSQMTTMTLQTLGHLVPTLHLVKYTHAAVMRSQDEAPAPSSEALADEVEGKGSPDPSGRVSGSPPLLSRQTSLLGRAAEWWSDEAREGHVILNDKHVRGILKRNGLTTKEADEGEEIPDGQLLLSAKMAVKMLKEQGAKPSEHWVYTQPGTSVSDSTQS